MKLYPIQYICLNTFYKISQQLISTYDFPFILHFSTVGSSAKLGIPVSRPWVQEVIQCYCPATEQGRERWNASFLTPGLISLCPQPLLLLPLVQLPPKGVSAHTGSCPSHPSHRFITRRGIQERRRVGNIYFCFSLPPTDTPGELQNVRPQTVKWDLVHWHQQDFILKWDFFPQSNNINFLIYKIQTKFLPSGFSWEINEIRLVPGL